MEHKGSLALWADPMISLNAKRISSGPCGVGMARLFVFSPKKSDAQGLPKGCAYDHIQLN